MSFEIPLEAIVRFFPGIFLAWAAQFQAPVNRSALAGAVRDRSRSSIPPAVQAANHLRSAPSHRCAAPRSRRNH
jgi:hypothetical protein